APLPRAPGSLATGARRQGKARPRRAGRGRGELASGTRPWRLALPASGRADGIRILDEGDPPASAARAAGRASCGPRAGGRPALTRALHRPQRSGEGSFPVAETPRGSAPGTGCDDVGRSVLLGR